MTREKEIFTAASKYIEDNSMLDGFVAITDHTISFIEVADWADAHSKSPWISVKDRLPEQDEEVIVLCDELNTAPFYKISFAHIVDKTMCQDYNGWNIPNVIYCFPMPKFPKE